MACIVPGIPLRLHKEGRETDNDFSIDTKIYIRVESKYFLREQNPTGDPDIYISHNAFKTDSQSCNRDKYSERDDVLLNINATSIDDHFYNWGVISINKDLILHETFNHPELPLVYMLGITHSIEECMYPHSEITIFNMEDEGKNNTQLNSKSLKAKIRAFFADRLVIEKWPD